MALAVLAVCPRFPSEGRAADGQSVYVHAVGRALFQATGARLHVAAMRVGDDAAVEEGAWFRVERVAPSIPCASLDALYARGVFPASMAPLAAHARAMASRLRARGRPVAWCHGYETGPAAKALRRAGVPVVAVSHFAVAEESAEFLQMATEPARARAAGLPMALGASVPPALRAAFVRAAGRAASLHPLVPSSSLALQLARLGMERALLEHAGRVVAVGRSYARTLADHHPRVGDRIAWACAGAPPIAPRATRSTDRVRLLMVGRLCPQKGWDYVADALEVLERAHPADAARLSWSLVGGPSPGQPPPSPFAADVLRRLDALRLVEIRHEGLLDPDALRARYDRADVLVHPSRYEPFGLVLLEAMARGCAVVAADADGPRDLVAAPRLPWSRPERRVPALVDALVRVARASRDELAADGEQAQRALAARADLTWDACASVHLRALEDVARR